MEAKQDSLAWIRRRRISGNRISTKYQYLSESSDCTSQFPKHRKRRPNLVDKKDTANLTTKTRVVALSSRDAKTLVLTRYLWNSWNKYYKHRGFKMKIPLSAYENAWEMIKRESVGSAAILILVAHDCDAIAACRTLQVR